MKSFYWIRQKKGIREGRKEGREESVEKNKKEIALKMKESGIDVNLIANITGLSVEAIEKLA